MAKSVSDITHRVPDEVVVFLGALVAVLPINPIAMPFVRRDSGVFLYAGARLLDGYLPYKDVWDNKPPIIYFINALGLSIFNGSRWGIWLLEFTTLLLAALLGLRLLRNIFGSRPAVMALCLGALGFVTLTSGGNYATEYTILLQFACFALIYESERRGNYSWRGYLIGLLTGIAFLTKQNTIGIGIAVALYLTISRVRNRHWKTGLKDLGLICFGGITPIVLAIFFFTKQDAMQQFWDAAFIYNYVRASSNLVNFFKSTIIGMIYLSTLTFVAWVGWLSNLLWRLGKLPLPEGIDRSTASFLLIGCIDLPIELIAASTTGFSYRHYYLALLPIYSIFAGFAFWLLFAHLLDAWLPKKAAGFLPIALAAIFMIPLAGAVVVTIKDLKFDSSASIDYQDVVTYVKSHTSEQDFVLMWGAETAINYSSQRLSPSRFVYQYPLFKQGYANESIIAEFLGDVIRHKPRLIIDTKNPSTPIFAFRISSPQIQDQVAFLQANYKIKESLGPWTVYESVMR